MRLDELQGQAVIDLWPSAGQLLKLKRSTTYDCARRGEIPTLRLGRRLVVPVPALRLPQERDDAC